MYHVIWGDVLKKNIQNHFSAETAYVYHIMVVFQNHIKFASFWLIVKWTASPHLSGHQYPLCSVAGAGVVGMRMALAFRGKTWKRCVTWKRFPYLGETRHVFFSVGVGGVLLLGRWITDITVDNIHIIFHESPAW